MTRTQIVRGGRRLGVLFWAPMVFAIALLLVTLVRHAAGAQTQPPCDLIDFNQDGVFPDTQDLDDFRAVFAGGTCLGQQPADIPCNTDIDFNNDGVFPDTADIEAFIRVMAGGPCVLAPTVDGPVWQDYRGGPSARRVYVSSSLGSDTNDGSEARPVRTAPKGFTLLLAGTGDALFLRRGDVFNEHLGAPDGAWNKGGMHRDRPLWIGAYGDTSLPRPVVHGIGAPGGAALRFQSGGGVSYVAVDSLDLEWVTGSPGMGISYWTSGTDLLIQNCRVSGFGINIALEGDLDRAVVRGSAVQDATPRGAHSQGFYIDRAKVLVEWCLIDRNGRLPNGDGTVYNHGAYVTTPTTGVAFEHCLVSRNSATGLQLRAQDTSARWCLVLDNPLGVTTGHADIMLKQERNADGTYRTVWRDKYPEWGWRGQVLFTLIVGGGDISPTKVGTVDWLPRGLPMGLGFVNGGTFRGNIVMQVAGGDPWAWSTGGLTTSWVVENNTVYAPPGRLFKDDNGQATRPAYGAGNLFTQSPIPAGATFDDYLASVGFTSRNDFLVAARAAWSREGWSGMGRFSPDAAYQFVQQRLSARSTP